MVKIDPIGQREAKDARIVQSVARPNSMVKRRQNLGQ
jgi:hypothetical protein